MHGSSRNVFLSLLNRAEFAELVISPTDNNCSARDWDGKDYLRIIPRVVW
jgi:hypothetical protein